MNEPIKPASDHADAQDDFFLDDTPLKPVQPPCTDEVCESCQ